MPSPASGEDPATGWTVTRWLGGLGLGLIPIAAPASFPGPGRGSPGSGQPGARDRRSVVMYGVPSGVVWDPAGGACK